MNRPIPGTVAVAGREFIYIESFSDETFLSLAETESTVGVNLIMPLSGGAIEERVRVTLNDGTVFMGISYKADIEGWRARYTGFCAATNRRYAVIKDGLFSISSGETFSLQQVEVVFV